MDALLQAIANFFMGILDALLNGGVTFLNSLGPIVEWVIYLIASLPMLAVAYFVGWKMIVKPALAQAAQFLAFGKDWWKVMLRMALITGIIILVFWMIIANAGKVGNITLQSLAYGLNGTPVKPPAAGEKVENPLNFGGNDNATPAPATDAPPADVPAPTAAPSSADCPTCTHKVTMADGATERDPGSNGQCDDDDALTGTSIPFGKPITVTNSWSSNNIQGARVLVQETGTCVHDSALGPYQSP